MWRAVTRWATGTRHQQQGMPCQDYGGDRILNDILVGAVADGAGSAAHAEVGARVAVHAVLDFLTASEDWLLKHQKSWDSLPQDSIEALAQKFFGRTVEKVNATLQQQAHQGGYPVSELACTLLAVLATPHWIAAMQIGDGFIVVRLHEQEYKLLFHPDKGEYANQTTFVTSSDALQAMQTRVVVGQPQFICAATDGLEKVAIRRVDAMPFPPFFNPLEEYLWETSTPHHDDEYLVSFLESDRLNQRTDDDKTLLLCLYTHK